MKKCSKCRRTKRLSEFSKHRGTKDGRQVWCKKCLGARNKRWFADNPERKLELNRRWRKDNAERLRTNRLAWYAKNSARVRAQKRAWYAKQNAEAMRLINRRRNLGRYGLSESQYKALLARQGGGCAVCGARPRNRRLSVDHCHRSRVVRGILCAGCNFAIGCMADSPDRLRAAAAYLERVDRSAEE